MKFSINSKTFLSALKAVKNVVPSKAVIQILETFLIEVTEDGIRITASDNENRASITVTAFSTEGSGAFCVDADFLTKVISSLPDCLVDVEVLEDGNVNIAAAKSVFATTSYNAEHYPSANFEETAIASFSMPTATLLTGLNETAFACSADDFHPQMMGVCFDVKPEQVVFVATDSRQLVKSWHQVQTNVETRSIISRNAIAAVSALACKESDVLVTVYPTAIEFKGAAFKLRCQLIKGNYPPYDRVIPTNNTITAQFNLAELTGAVKRMMLCSERQYGLLRIKFDNNSAKLSTTDAASVRAATETIDCVYNGSPMSIGLSVNYLMEQLSAIQSTNVVLSMSEPTRPIIITPDNEDKHMLMLLMPLNIAE